MKCAVLLVLALVAAAYAAPKENLITTLPGYNDTWSFDMYAGYETVNETLGRNLFYWFVEAVKSPGSAPVVVWLNGGPGCSSMDGFLSEHGPFHLSSNTTLFANPYSWNNVANILYIDSPAGVGLSYTETETDQYEWTDNKVADDLYEFLMQWYKDYPEFAENDLYIAGESYAGHYVPVFTNRIRLGNLAGGNMPLKGLLVGNGVTDDYYDGQAYIPFVCYHALLSDSMCSAVDAACNGEYWNASSTECVNMLNKAYAAMGDINIYDIYQPCAGGEAFRQREGHDYPMWELRARYSVTAYEPIIPCISTENEHDWLNSDDVREAIHAVPVSQQEWWICNMTINEYYTPGYASMLPFYTDFMEAGYRTLVYSGDVDSAVPWTGTEAWVDSLQLTEVMEWQPWYYVNNVAGYATAYDNDFTFVTVLGSGHMVPQFKPPQALEMFNLFMNKIPFNTTDNGSYSS